MSFLSEAHICKYLFCIEKLTPVNKYLVEGLHLWPISRIYLSSILKKIDWYQEKKLTENPIWLSMVSKIEQLFTEVSEQCFTPSGSLLEPASLPKYAGNQSPAFDYLFFSRSDDCYTFIFVC